VKITHAGGSAESSLFIFEGFFENFSIGIANAKSKMSRSRVNGHRGM
jgi:hypothetical protein